MLLATGNIERLANPPLTFCRQAVGQHHILYVREISGLEPVAMDFQTLPLKCSRQKPWDDGCVLRLRILPWAKDIEVAQRYGRQAVEGCKDSTEFLPCQLRNRVRRNRGCVLFLPQGETVVVAVDGGG